jgi:hypothetical protein
METVKETLIVGGHRMLAAQESERIPDDAGADPDERRLTERGRPALTPATMNIAQAAAHCGTAVPISMHGSRPTPRPWTSRRKRTSTMGVDARGATSKQHPAH